MAPNDSPGPAGSAASMGDKVEALPVDTPPGALAGNTGGLSESSALEWIVEERLPNGAYVRVTAGLPRDLTAEQARAYARAWSWQRNGWFKARLGVPRKFWTDC